ncbi:MAG: ECF transporter S component [Clostridia bacterium]|nr:ECF transporter S component [Clostridia bacterium]
MATKVNSNIKRITVIAVLCAIAYLVSFIFPFKVSFLTFDLKDAIIAISALMYGPIAGLVSSVIVPFLEFITTSETGIYGFIMNFLSSAAFSVTAGIIYKYRRSFSGAILSMCASVLAVTAIMLLANLFITPYYMGVEREMVVELIPSLLLPFNLIKSVINASLTLLIYKPITAAFGRMGMIERKTFSKENSLRSILLVLGCLAVAAAAVVVFVLYLGGTVEF